MTPDRAQRLKLTLAWTTILAVMLPGIVIITGLATLAAIHIWTGILT